MFIWFMHEKRLLSNHLKFIFLQEGIILYKASHKLSMALYPITTSFQKNTNFYDGLNIILFYVNQKRAIYIHVHCEASECPLHGYT